MLRRLMPRETNFFGYFERHSKLAIAVCRELDAMAANPSELSSRADRIKEIEHEADDVTHECIDALHRTFITSIDRADIHHLITGLDDIVDSVDSAVSRMMLYQMTSIRPELKRFTEVLMRATGEIDSAIRRLRHLNKEGEAINRHCLAVYEAEKTGDQILRAALARLFEAEEDPILIIKWKEVFERLERATDRCEAVANVVAGIVIEAS